VSMYVKNERLCPCVKIACIHKFAKNYVHVCVCRMRSVLLRLCPIVKDCMHTYICEELHTCVCVCVCMQNEKRFIAYQGQRMQHVTWRAKRSAAYID
jgi:hypothetical protein